MSKKGKHEDTSQKKCWWCKGKGRRKKTVWQHGRLAKETYGFPCEHCGGTGYKPRK